MKKHYYLFCFTLLLFSNNLVTSQSFSSSGLSGESVNNPTSLTFGPDDRLYVSQQSGTIFAYTIIRNGPNDYDVTATETINTIKDIGNHNDDGSIHSNSNRQITGLFLAGTANSPILYVTSSDHRIGGGGGGSDVNLDTNSGVVSKLTKNGSSWVKVDLVRGLPRSEENHASNGMYLDETTNILYMAQGGHTNAGSPSNNFAFLTEYALSAAILSIDLNMIESMPTLTDAASGNLYKYNLPTVDDPTRNNVNGQDVNDPFGGNDGLNQAKLVVGGPVQIFSPGFRNAYDIVKTKAGNFYTWDNGANKGWGGHPANEGGANVTNNWIQGEPGSSGPGPNDPVVNNRDGLHIINSGYYGGHPNPIRANPNGAGLFTNDQSGGINGVWRTTISGDLSTTLPVDWPPVPTSLANPIEGDFQNPGEDDGALHTTGFSTNGLTEYTASNFGNALNGDLLAAGFNGSILRVDLNANGIIDDASNVTTFASGFGSTPLDVHAVGDDGLFPGTVWATTYGSDNITIFEPADYDSDDTNDCNAVYDITLDEDSDGYSNADEIDNGTDPCNGAIIPEDFDKTTINGFLVSNLNDPDDDDDGFLDTQDEFAWDAQNGQNVTIPIDYPFLNGDPGFGFFGLGFTGLMTNKTDDYLNLINDETNSATEIIAGGAVGLFTMNSVPDGDCYSGLNNQINSFQFGVNTDQNTQPFTIEAAILGPVFPNNALNFQSTGFYIGNGDQDNYLKIVVSAGSGTPDIEVLVENDGSPSSSHFTAPNIGSVSELSLFLSIDPSVGTVQPKYSTNRGNAINIGPIINLSGENLSVLQSNTKALAIGVISTSHQSGATNFNATWDFIKASYDNACSDQDNDGICDSDDQCPGVDDSIIGTPCDDNDDCTENDIYTNQCLCEGTLIDTNNNDICDSEEDECANGDILIFSETFTNDLGGFSLVSGLFGDSYPDRESQSFESGNLSLVGEGINNTTFLNMSYGVEHSFIVSNYNQITVNIQYELQAAAGFEPDEFSQAILAIDGNVIDYNNTPYLSQLVGGTPETTGVQTVSIEVKNLTLGEHTLSLGFYNNKTTWSTEITKLLIDEIEVIETCVSCEELVNTPCDDGDDCTDNDTFDEDCNCVGILIDANDNDVCDLDENCSNGVSNIIIEDFNSNLGGFDLVSGLFGQPEPNYESSVQNATNLELSVGGIDRNNIFDLSLGMEKSFIITETGQFTLTIDYELTAASDYENDEFTQFIVAIDGNVINYNGNNYIYEIVGGNPVSSGSQSVSLAGALSAGEHTLSIGLFNNKKTWENEISTLIIDRLELTELCPSFNRSSYSGNKNSFVNSELLKDGIVNNGLDAEGDILLYPNPTSSSLKLVLNNKDQNLRASKGLVFNTIGSLVKQFSGAELAKKELDVRELSSGTYFLVVRFNEGNQVFKKFVVAK